MKDRLKTGFTDRIAAAADAKKALLAKLKPRAAVAHPDFDNRHAEKAAELEAVRQERAAAKEAARQSKAKANAALERERLAAALAELQAKRGGRSADRKNRR